MPRTHRPRRGSLAYSPRKRAKTQVPRIQAWPEQAEPKLQSFAGYKAGMAHVLMVDDRPNSVTEGMEISVPVTVVEAPSMRVAAIRAYKDSPYGKKIIAEAWAEEQDEELNRVTRVPRNYDAEAALEKVENAVEDADEVRVITYTQPKLVSGVPKKKPDVMESALGGGTPAEQLEYAKGLLGKEVSISDVFDAGKLVDVAAITKGKGTQGPVKRWGTQLQKRKHSRGGKLRHIGNLGPWNPSHISWRVPQMGQTGYHQRTEFNKRILKIGANGEEITPKGGFVNYGEVRNDFVLIKGSLPGPTKRLVRMRPALRPKELPEGEPQIVHVSTRSQQGART